MKKGFTLVELLAVIAILGLLGLIAVPVVTNTIKKSRTDLYNVQISNIKDAAKVWASDNIASLPEETNESTIVTLGTLKNNGLVESDIKDPRDKTLFSDTDTCVVITKTSTGYNYVVSFDDDCTNE